jgi:hypothetical protein
VQDVFVTGSVLAVDCTVPIGFFPDIYNEDWLFFYRDAADACLTSSGLTAKQIPYNPFEDPQRAAGQEFGDVIAEGLYALLDSDLRDEFATEIYWRAFLAGRKRVLDEIVERLTDTTALIERQDEMFKAIYAAREKLWYIEPSMCVAYIKAWHRDLDRWADLLERLPRADSIDAALGELKLPFVAR